MKEGCFMLSSRGLDRLLLVLIVVSVASTPSVAASIRNRIMQPINQGETIEVPNSVNPKARRASDMGPVAADTRLTSMTLQVSMSPEQEATLDQLLSDQQNPASARYHQWLTPPQFAAQFGLSDADLGKVKAWLNNQGFTV